MKKYVATTVSEENGSEEHRFPRGEGGFSLVELLIAMTVGLVILGGVYSVFILQNKTFSTQEDVLEMQQNVRAGMDMMTREIGLAGYDPRRVNSDSSTSNNFNGVTVSTSQLQIRADLNGDGAITSGEENIIYAYDATNKQITRNIGSGNQPFIEGVESFTFVYLKEDGVTPATTAADVRRIRITIKGRTSKPDPKYPYNDGHRYYELTSVVSPRNLGYIYN
jgi:type IV pilus assembly protein PilW